MTSREHALCFPPLELENTTSSVLEITIEINPDRYLLKPGEKMVVEVDASGLPFTIRVYDGGLQIYAGDTAGAAVAINDSTVEPDWQTEV